VGYVCLRKSFVLALLKSTTPVVTLIGMITEVVERGASLEVSVGTRFAAGRSAIILLLLVIVLPALARAVTAQRVTLYPIPPAVRSTHYRVTVDGHSTPVVHAANQYYLLNFDTTGPVEVSVTADDPHFWDRGVEIEPMRLGIRPERHGATIRFHLSGPQKITISRPGGHFANDDMLFLFANPPETSGITASTPGVRYYGPGVYHESIDAHSGDTIYLAGGAVVFGSLNIWQVHDVHVLGRGMIVYDGPQTPLTDTGWMHKRNWHAIVMDNARNVEIDGITTVVRSRTWQVQMKDSRNIGFYNVKEIAGTPGDANGDGMDWLGGGSTTVRDGFIRAADDVYALQGNWNGYSDESMHTPGHDVTDITISDSVVSTSISNIIRVAWPEKIFNSAHFHMSNMDVVATGYGSCKVPFAFFELWADPDGKGTHSDYTFSNIRLENWYSLFQIRYPNPFVKGVRFSGVWAMNAPAMVPSALLGSVSDVTLDDVPQTQGQSVEVLQGAEAPRIEPEHSGFDYTAGALRPRQNIAFTASEPAAAGRRFDWLFGDGATAHGRMVHHVFRDTEGTLLDGSGRFRVLLHVSEPGGRQAWVSQPVVLANKTLPAMAAPAPAVNASLRKVDVEKDGGYTFWVLSRGRLTVSLDGLPSVQGPVTVPPACGVLGNAVQPVELSGVLRAGTHSLVIQGEGAATARIIWQGPGLPRQLLPDSTQATPQPSVHP
jgi:hypothetical protein